MLSSWWFLWVIFMLMFMATPVGYGWGYRGWGPPYPRYIQRRRAERSAAAATSPAFDHHAWGVGGDVLWVVLLIWIFWGGWVLLLR
jgi:hypothetical protein